MTKEQFKVIENYMLLNTKSSSHDKMHTYRVLNNALKIAKKEKNVNMGILITSALLHDIAREKEKNDKTINHAIEGANMAYKFLLDNNYSENFALRVKDCIETHRFRSNNKPTSIEAKILFDADKLDSLGAVGVGRAFLFAGHFNARLHNTETEALNSESYSREDTAYREYLVKLRYLPRRMRSTAGRKMAVERAAFMTAFFERMNSEIYSGDTDL